MSGENSQIRLLEAPKPSTRRLSKRQRLFIECYLSEANLSATKAAKMAGYAELGASNVGSRNLRNVRILREIERRLEQMGLTPLEITGRLGKMARGEIPTKTVDKAGEITKTFDERQALEDAARIHGMLIDKHQIQALPGLLIEDAE